MTDGDDTAEREADRRPSRAGGRRLLLVAAGDGGGAGGRARTRTCRAGPARRAARRRSSSTSARTRPTPWPTSRPTCCSRRPGRPRGHVLLGYDERGHCPMLVDERVHDLRAPAGRPVAPTTAGCCPAAGVGGRRRPARASAGRSRRWRFDHPSPTDRDRSSTTRCRPPPRSCATTPRSRELGSPGPRSWRCWRSRSTTCSSTRDPATGASVCRADEARTRSTCRVDGAERRVGGVGTAPPRGRRTAGWPPDRGPRTFWACRRRPPPSRPVHRTGPADRRGPRRSPRAPGPGRPGLPRRRVGPHLAGHRQPGRGDVRRHRHLHRAGHPAGHDGRPDPRAAAGRGDRRPAAGLLAGVRPLRAVPLPDACSTSTSPARTARPGRRLVAPAQGGAALGRHLEGDGPRPAAAARSAW